MDLAPPPPDALDRPRPGYWLTRFALLRLLGLVYAAAFYSLATQVLPLIGSQGLTPAAPLLQRIAERAGSPWQAFQHLPSLFFLHVSDALLLGLSWAGVALSLLLAGGCANAVLLFVLWALYLSFVHIGQVWYGYGWELLLCEAGFLAIFLCPLADPRPFPRRPPPAPVIWLYRWLAFRVMFGAGLIKLRGDACWRELTCLDYHFETQPVPSPLSPLFHFLPAGVHRLGVLFNHFAELIAPFGAFGPRPVRHLAGAVMAAFQLTLILSGNLSFLNWLTLVPILACFDDALLARLLPGRLLGLAARAQAAAAPPTRAGQTVIVALCCVVGVLSIAPTANLLSSRQRMNDAFDPFNLVNTYGAFGSVGSERNEIIFEGTRDSVLSGSTRWLPYEFKCKPGDPARRPCLMSPLQYRLDWQIWFAAMGDPAAEPWTVHLVYKLLQGDPATLGLLAGNPFPDGPPRYIRAELYRYRFAPLGEKGWWQRTHLGPWLPPLSIGDERLRAWLIEYGWMRP